MSARLRDVLDDAVQAEGCALKDLTVLAPANDPYRADVPRFREAGEWFARHFQRVGGRRHCRGWHYALLGEPKPDGTPYTNTEADWRWIQEQAVDGARWLGLIPFDGIVDERNQPPVVRTVTRVDAEPYISVGRIRLEVPTDMSPSVWLWTGDHSADERVAVEPYRLAIFGEKVSLDAVVSPIALGYGASVYLPTGEASDSVVHAMMADAAADGRKLIVFYLSDCDPSGWQMAVSVARKMQAFRDLLFAEVEFELQAVALTPTRCASMTCRQRR